MILLFVFSLSLCVFIEVWLTYNYPLYFYFYFFSFPGLLECCSVFLFFFYVIFFFQFYLDIIDIQHCISLRSTEWFDLHTSWNGYHSRFSEHLSFHIDAKWKKRKIVFFLIRTVEIYCLQFSSVQSLSCVRLFATPWIAACQASLSINNSRSSLKLTSIKSVMPSSHLILCRPLLLMPPILPSIRVFSNESALRMRWPKYWKFQLQHQSFQWTPRTDFL